MNHDSQTAKHRIRRRSAHRPLTADQWNTLYFYLLTSTKYRNGEIEAWERLALETNEDGSPKFIHAADNARYLRDQEKTLHEIAQSIC